MVEEKKISEMELNQQKAVYYLIHREVEEFQKIAKKNLNPDLLLSRIIHVENVKETFDRLQKKFPGIVDAEGKTSIPKLMTALYIESDDPKVLDLLVSVIKSCKYSQSDIDFMTKYDPPKKIDALVE
jgi:FKBP-type peptidyl-prolyl cis-trans isomerase (trigger factor)